MFSHKPKDLRPASASRTPHTYIRLITDLYTVEPRNLLPTSLLDEFPILKQTINGRPLVYLDNGATTQKPQAVIDAVRARGFTPADDNEADAIAILLWAIETRGGVR